jgi:hypothetical protein
MRRYAAAACLVLAPIALAISTGVDPALGDGEIYGVYRAHPDAIQWHSLLLHWSWALFVPGLLGLLSPIRRRGGALARVAWYAIIYGLVTFSALMAADFALLAWEQTLPNDQVAQVNDAFGALPWAVGGWQIPGLVGWALALIVTPIAAARAKVISWWTAGAALAGTALYFLFAISPVPLCLAGPVVLIGAYGAAAWQLLRAKSGDDPEPDAFGAFRHRAGIVCLYAAPVAFAVGMATVPGLSADPAQTVAHPQLTQASAFFLHLAWVLFIPAVLVVMRHGGRFTRVIGGATVVGLINFSGLMVGDYTDLAARQVLGDAAAEKISETLGGYALFSLGWAVPGMVLSLVGLILVAIGAAVDKLAPWWLPALVFVGFALFFALGVGPLGILGPVVLLVAFALLGRRLTGPVQQTTVDADAAGDAPTNQESLVNR